MAKPTVVPGLKPQTPRGTAGPLLIAARLADARRHEAAVAERLDGDAVHDMRVATRRLRAALKLFGDGDRGAVDRELKGLQDALGAVRDVQVQLAWLAASERRLRSPERAMLRAWISAPLDRHAAALRTALRRWNRKVAADVEGAATAARGGRLGGKKMKKRLDRRVRRAERLARRARADPEPVAAHELRIAVKKLRYTAELLQPAFTGRIDPLLDALEPLQETLGMLHDADVRIERLTRLARRGAPVQRRAAHRLLELLQPERERLAGQLVAELQAVSLS